ncbi:MAG: 6-hydroxycyclohex-1-ene-1-carbonyl-CoA dehydrogenase [Bacteroidetes bacterium]|nr:6-hydroxycyclohex-1-ene-1-carbonyl-CoA dehydrogenase [Bacteroidota bacterium]
MKNNHWQFIEKNRDFILTEKPIPPLAPGEALIKVAGCGVCHTDISFWHHGVPTRHPLPLTLGHEISGTVVDGPSEWMGKNAIVPAVLPCGECDLCRSGRSNICQNQKMPGNDFDGGFANYVVVPARFLCAVPDSVLKKYPLEMLAVIADAVSTPYQVIKKSGLNPGDFAIAIGVGGIGIYGALIAKIAGAKVLALDISDEKLQIASENGIDAVLNTGGMDFKTIKNKIREIAQKLNAPRYAWKIFEFSGTKAGQEMGFNLLTYASTMSVVGFTLDKLEVRISNLMAFDAQLTGTWGCKPELYPEVVDLVGSGKIPIDRFVQILPMSEINGVFRNTLEHKYLKRVVLITG